MKNENIDIIINKTKNFLVLTINDFDFNEKSSSSYYIKHNNLFITIDGVLFQINLIDRNIPLDDNTKLFLAIENNQVLEINKLDNLPI